MNDKEKAKAQAQAQAEAQAEAEAQAKAKAQAQAQAQAEAQAKAKAQAQAEAQAEAQAQKIKTIRVTAKRRIVVSGKLKDKGASFAVNPSEKWVHVALANGYIIDNETAGAGEIKPEFDDVKGKGSAKK